MSDRIDPQWAWAPYRPTSQAPWDLAKVGHLYRRAAFGASWAELQAGLADGPEHAVEKLLKGGDTAAFLSGREVQPPRPIA